MLGGQEASRKENFQFLVEREREKLKDFASVSSLEWEKMIVYDVEEWKRRRAARKAKGTEGDSDDELSAMEEDGASSASEHGFLQDLSDSSDDEVDVRSLLFNERDLSAPRVKPKRSGAEPEVENPYRHALTWACIFIDGFSSRPAPENTLTSVQDATAEAFDFSGLGLGDLFSDLAAFRPVDEDDGAASQLSASVFTPVPMTPLPPPELSPQSYLAPPLISTPSGLPESPAATPSEPRVNPPPSLDYHVERTVLVPHSILPPVNTDLELGLWEKGILFDLCDEVAATEAKKYLTELNLDQNDPRMIFEEEREEESDEDEAEEVVPEIVSESVVVKAAGRRGGKNKKRHTLKLPNRMLSEHEIQMKVDQQRLEEGELDDFNISNDRCVAIFLLGLALTLVAFTSQSRRTRPRASAWTTQRRARISRSTSPTRQTRSCATSTALASRSRTTSSSSPLRPARRRASSARTTSFGAPRNCRLRRGTLWQLSTRRSTRPSSATSAWARASATICA